MNYLDPQLRSLLAGEYVLGTLRGRARQRFERLLATDTELQRDLAEWEGRLNNLNESLQPVKPPKRVWRKINARLTPEPRLKPSHPWNSLWVNLWIWRGLAVGALATSLVLGFLLLELPHQTPFVPDYLAVVRDQAAKPLWLIQADTKHKVLAVRVVEAPPLQGGKSYELWLLPGKDQAPQSMGLLPVKDRREFSLVLAQRLPQAVGLAVSLEPAGGSPTGLPTGPVLFQADLVPAG